MSEEEETLTVTREEPAITDVARPKGAPSTIMDLIKAARLDVMR